jgi:hypothetical protein
MTRTPEALPHTIARLRALRPGERMMWYRGRPHLETVGPGPYRDLIRAVFKEADDLERRGRIVRSSEKIRIALPPDKNSEVGRVEVISHFALGLEVVS